MCHKNSDFKQPVAHEKCADCHEDVHKGQFAGRAAGSDCAACHTETSFKPSLYTREQHQKSRFPLEGKHATMECAQCHKPAGRDAKYKLETTTCAQCHMDAHAGQFAGAAYANRCESCHTQITFAPSTYSLARHAQTKFVLTGAHAAVLCADCHKPLTVAATPAARQYHFADQNCTTCHNDPHRTTLACETCHNTNQWKELRPFDHSTTKFPLEGAHQSATCVSCHRPAQGSSLAKTKPTPDFSVPQRAVPTVTRMCMAVSSKPLAQIRNARRVTRSANGMLARSTTTRLRIHWMEHTQRCAALSATRSYWQWMGSRSAFIAAHPRNARAVTALASDVQGSYETRAVNDLVPLR